MNTPKKRAFFNKYWRVVKIAADKYQIRPEILMAIMAHETAWGRSDNLLKGNNPGGVTTALWRKTPYWSPTDGTRDRPKNEGGTYNKYKTLELGLLDNAYLLTYKRYHASFKLQNDTAEFAARFVKTGYFTGDPEIYRKSLVYNIPQFKKAYESVTK
ncbi:glucosaminidase domain-containing protein [Siphonobacter sp.]|uniref:glucosaminidase domain-containing protein n=1 Tax=Siphonobacter sp. TaxID=1869184 RepID=UPI003B3ABA73